MKMQETAQNLKNTLCRVRGTENEVTSRECSAAVSKKQRLERKEACLVLHETYFSLEKMVKALVRRETGLSVENRYGRMLAELLKKEALQFLAECVTECALLEKLHLCKKCSCKACRVESCE